MAFWHTKLSVCRVQEKEELRQRIRTQDRKIERLEARQTGLALIVCLSISPSMVATWWKSRSQAGAFGQGALPHALAALPSFPWLPKPIERIWYYYQTYFSNEGMFKFLVVLFLRKRIQNNKLFCQWNWNIHIWNWKIHIFFLFLISFLSL